MPRHAKLILHDFLLLSPISIWLASNYETIIADVLGGHSKGSLTNFNLSSSWADGIKR
jgi:hypothetical protein